MQLVLSLQTATMEIDLSRIPNKDQWVAAAREAAGRPDDFEAWENLVQLTEFLPSLNVKTKYPVSSRSPAVERRLVLLAYENLLVNFPLLEQYWVNYATWFYTFNDLAGAVETFERALLILPQSLLIWNAYLDVQLRINSDNAQMLASFERAREAIGYHYLGSPFFDKYLLFLKNNRLVREYHLVLRKIIEIPQHDYLKYFKTFLNLIEDADLDTIKFLVSKSDLKADFGLTWDDLLRDENLRKLKLELRKKFLDLFITVQYHSWKFYYFEKNLSTHYFVPNEKLSRLELQTWRSYIEYVETLNLKAATKEKELSLIKNNISLIDTLYSRCLIPAASYPFFWIKLSNYYLNYNDLDSAKLVLLKGVYLNPVANLKVRLRLVDLYILSSEFDKARCLVYESLQLLPNNLQLFCKLLEIQHFTQASSVSKLIVNKLTEIPKLKNKELEEQFDWLFVEMLDYSCITVEKLAQIFEMFKDKKSPHYLKAKKMFHETYKLDGLDPLKTAKIPQGWECVYF